MSVNLVLTGAYTLIESAAKNLHVHRWSAGRRRRCSVSPRTINGARMRAEMRDVQYRPHRRRTPVDADLAFHDTTPCRIPEYFCRETQNDNTAHARTAPPHRRVL